MEDERKDNVVAAENDIVNKFEMMKDVAYVDVIVNDTENDLGRLGEAANSAPTVKTNDVEKFEYERRGTRDREHVANTVPTVKSIDVVRIEKGLSDATDGENKIVSGNTKGPSNGNLKLTQFVNHNYIYQEMGPTSSKGDGHRMENTQGQTKENEKSVHHKPVDPPGKIKINNMVNRKRAREVQDQVSQTPRKKQASLIKYLSNRQVVDSPKRVVDLLMDNKMETSDKLKPKGPSNGKISSPKNVLSYYQVEPAGTGDGPGQMLTPGKTNTSCLDMRRMESRPGPSYQTLGQEESQRSISSQQVILVKEAR